MSQPRFLNRDFDKVKDDFIHWLNRNESRNFFMRGLAGSLQTIIDYNISTRSIDCRTILDNLLPVLSQCDEDIYDDEGVVLAYVYIHFLERYRRTWHVLEELVKINKLPIRSDKIEALEIGAGPASNLYAINDFFKSLRSFSKERSYAKLTFDLPTLNAIERSFQMNNFFHILSEEEGREGPYGSIFHDLKGVNFKKARDLVDYQYIEKVAEEMETSEGRAEEYINRTEGGLHQAFRFNLVIFCNFLTQKQTLEYFYPEIISAFESVRRLGLVIIMGGSDKKYSKLYSDIENIANDRQFVRISLPQSIPWEYSSSSAQIIKDFYSQVWDYFEEKNCVSSKHRHPDLKDVWDPAEKLRGPKHFGLRVFQKVAPSYSHAG